MAGKKRTSAAVRAARNSLIWLTLILVALTTLNWVAVTWQQGSWAPKLALDLEGGTQVVLEAKLAEGQAAPSPDQMAQAVSIIRQRVDAAGVSEAEITTQGGRNVVVSVPGEMDEETRKRVESSAKLEFRPVLLSTEAANVQALSPEDLGVDPDKPEPEPTPTDASDKSQVTSDRLIEFAGYDCASPEAQSTQIADPKKPVVTCNTDGTEKYLLGPVEIEGSSIRDASSGMGTNSQGVATGQWVVNLEFDATGTKQFREVTTRLNGYLTQPDPETGQVDTNRGRFAVTMDNRVITAPTAEAVITDGKSQISGSFTEESAKQLADQLKFGALPFNFETKSSQTISATLGSWQLQAGLIAGAIGLTLVVIYSLVQYRALGIVTVASLALLAGLTYLVVTLLSSQEGYRLSLAGVAGLIVAIGITADSFIVYFERIKDELREGRTLAAAVEHGWRRAIRTILASDAVNFLVAGVLFIVAVGNVRGFAITLGITTIIDLVVVTLFTHPVMQLLSQTRFFGGGHPMSGLDPRALGAVYRGRGEFAPRAKDTKSLSKRNKRAAGEAQRRQTLAERRAAEARAASETTAATTEDK